MTAERKPVISIITVTLNALPLLQKTISATAKLEIPFEHWIIDGGSSDGTLHWLNENGSRSPNLKWSSGKDNGIYDAMNKGLASASGDYVWFLNAGDLPFSNTVLNPLMSSPEPDVLYGDAALIDATGEHIGTTRAPHSLAPELLVRGMYVSHQSFIVRRAIAPPYDARYRYIADNKWALDCMRRSSKAIHGGILSKYLMGGLSERNYGKFWLEKVRFTADEIGWAQSLPILCIDLLKGARFYGGKLIRSRRKRS